MSSIIENILKEYVDGLIKIIGNDLKQILLYGSYARGEPNDDGEISDIDIMILVNATDEEIKRIEKKVIDYSYDLDLKYNILLSPIIENIEKYKNRVKYIKYYKNIEKEGILLNG